MRYKFLSFPPFCFLIAGLLILSGCNKAIYTGHGPSLRKSIAIETISMQVKYNGSGKIKDTLCDCVATNFTQYFRSFFSQSGIQVVEASDTSNNGITQKPDFLIKGNAAVIQIVKKGKASFYMTNINLQLISKKDNKIIATAAFSGPGINPARVARVSSNSFLAKL